jgi:outer membrane protein TolC
MLIRSVLSVLLVVCVFAVNLSAQPLTLEQVIRDVCTQSDSVKMMKESITKSNQIVREKRANALPVIAATGAYAHSYGSAFGGSSSSSGSSRSMAKQAASGQPGLDDPVTYRALNAMMSGFNNLSDPSHSNIYSAGLSFNQPIYTFGKISSAISVAKNYGNSARATFRRGIQTMQLDAFDAFFRLHLAEMTLEAARQSLERKKSLHEFLAGNFSNGSGSKAQVLQTKAEITAQQATIIAAHRDAELTRMNLNRLSGRPLVDTAALDISVLPARISGRTIPDVTDAVRTAIQNRQDIKSIRFLAESNRGGARIMRTMYYPTIGANGSLGYSRLDSDREMFKNDGTPSWMLGVGVQWTLFDGFANSARSAEYLSDARKLDAFASTMERMVEMEVRGAIIECAAADSNSAAIAEMYSAVRESYQLTKVEFEQGSGRLVELQQAEELLQETELAMASAHYRVVRSYAALLVAMGENIVEMEDNE